jgi:single-strand DNA-binding protein
MNKSILLGRLTKNPEIRYSQANNIKVANFTLAVNRKYVKPGEERQTDFINIVAYSKLAEFAEKYLKQGLQICLSGRIQTRTYEDNNGQKRYVTEIIAEEIDFADSMKKDKPDESILWANNQTTTSVENIEESITDSDDLPF